MEEPRLHPPFETNLALLRSRDGRYADAVAGATTAVAERHAGANGHAALRVAGLQLASAYDPVEEGRRVVAPLLARNPDLLVVIGVGVPAASSKTPRSPKSAA